MGCDMVTKPDDKFHISGADMDSLSSGGTRYDIIRHSFV